MGFKANVDLIDNSLKHTPEGGCVRWRLTKEEGEVQVTVSDTGYGIAAEEMPHIFKRFYRKSANTEDKSAHAGLGLGLATQFAVMPVLGFSAAVLAPLAPEVALGFIIVGCAPGAMASSMVNTGSKTS